MLVLGRKRRESVIVGGEVVVAVEEILGENGERILGARIRLGFQSPRGVSICRSELLSAGSADARPAASRGRGQMRPGRVVAVPDARVRLRIEVPAKIPVRWNDTLLAPAHTAPSTGETTQPAKQVHYVCCRKEDRITICHNITVAALNFFRFVFFDEGPEPPASSRLASQQGPSSANCPEQLPQTKTGDQPQGAKNAQHSSGPW